MRKKKTIGGIFNSGQKQKCIMCGLKTNSV